MQPLSLSDPLRRKELIGQVRQAIFDLSDLDREVLILRHFEELTSGEIAELLEIESAAASKRYGRALRRLREKLKDMGVSQ